MKYKLVFTSPSKHDQAVMKIKGYNAPVAWILSYMEWCDILGFNIFSLICVLLAVWGVTSQYLTMTTKILFSQEFSTYFHSKQLNISKNCFLNRTWFVPELGSKNIKQIFEFPTERLNSSAFLASKHNNDENFSTIFHVKFITHIFNSTGWIFLQEPTFAKIHFAILKNHVNYWK